MAYSSTEDDIRALFEPFGPIAEIRIIGDKGFGFVDIPEENMAAAIEATNGKELGGRTLTVNEARPRTDRGGGRGGGGRRWWRLLYLSRIGVQGLPWTPFSLERDSHCHNSHS